VQDTGYLKRTVEYPSSNLIYALFWKKNKGKYVLYENRKNRPGHLPVKYLDSCYNCIFIPKGGSLTFALKLQDCCNFEKGQYRMIAYLRAPPDQCDGCDQIVELESNYVYFTVKE
jgi:hypothetical protein